MDLQLVPSSPTAVDLGAGVTAAWTRIATFLPELALAAVIAAITWVVAKALAKAVTVVLSRVGFDDAVDRGGLRRFLARSGYDPSGVISRVVFVAVLLIGLSLAFGVFGPNPVTDYLNSIVAYLPRIVIAIVLVVVASAIARAVRDLVGTSLAGLSSGPVMATAASAVVLALGVIAALGQLDIAENVVNAVLYASLAAIVGVVVVGVGGGLVRPMQQRWEDALDRAGDERRRMGAHHRERAADGEDVNDGHDGGAGMRPEGTEVVTRAADGATSTPTPTVRVPAERVASVAAPPTAAPPTAGRSAAPPPAAPSTTGTPPSAAPPSAAPPTTGTPPTAAPPTAAPPTAAPPTAAPPTAAGPAGPVPHAPHPRDAGSGEDAPADHPAVPPTREINLGTNQPQP